MEVVITRNGWDRNVLISAAGFEVLIKGGVARRAEDLGDEPLKAIAEAEVPVEYAYLDKIDLD